MTIPAAVGWLRERAGALPDIEIQGGNGSSDLFQPRVISASAQKDENVENGYSKLPVGGRADTTGEAVAG